MLKPNAIRLLIPGLLLITLIACSSDDPAPAVVPPVTLADGVTAEPGSDEADVVSLIERVVTNLRVRDIKAFQADCHPDWQAKVSVDDLAASIEDESNWAGYGQQVFKSGFNVEILGFEQFRDTLTVTYMWREGENVIEPDLDLGLVLEREDSRWWMTARLGLCAGIGQTGTRGL